MTDTPVQTTHNLQRPLAHQLTATELAEALLAVRMANDDHLALCAEAAHRILVMHSANSGLTKEADRLRHHMRLANSRVDDMRNGMVTMSARLDDLRRTTDQLAPRAPVEFNQNSRLRHLHPHFMNRILDAFGQASMCWNTPDTPGKFDHKRASLLATDLALFFADELELAKLRRTEDDGVDWRRRALEAELRADAMQLGMMNAKATLLEDDLAERDDERAPGGLFGRLYNLLFKPKKDTP